MPTTLEDWEPGDPARDIDWLATLLGRGHELGPAMPVKRSLVAEYEGPDVPLWQPRIEIYLDVSGSMPDPRTTRNAMTLAAQILILAAIRAGGWARALLYSSATSITGGGAAPRPSCPASSCTTSAAGPSSPSTSSRRRWRSAAGTSRSAWSSPTPTSTPTTGPIPRTGAVFAEAVRASPRAVLLLHRPLPESVAAYRSAGATVVEVPQMDDFPRMAVDLAKALFPEARHAMV